MWNERQVQVILEKGAYNKNAFKLQEYQKNVSLSEDFEKASTRVPTRN